MITLHNISLRRGQHLLLENVNWTIFHKQRIGIIGANGAGKSSLFSLLLGELEADKGDFEKPAQLKLAHVAQETESSDQSALDYTLSGDHELNELNQALTIAEEKNEGERIALIHNRLFEIDAYSAKARAAELLNGLGFSFHEQERSMKQFSGGWRVRLNLAKALMSRSDVLLLDEPTNHLDLDAVIWLEKWLLHYQGTLLIISHDRDFLDHIVDHIAYLNHQQLKLYTGNYSTFEQLREMECKMQMIAFEKQQKKIAHLEQFINRFRAKASKAKQAQSRIKALARLETVAAIQMDSSFQFEFKEPKYCPNPLISIQDASVTYGDHTVLNHLNFSITPNDRIALIGPNGAGKTSFIQLLAGNVITPSGTVTKGAGLKIGYFAQHQIDYFNLAETPIDHLKKIAPTTREQELRSFLGGFGFTNARSFEPIRHFSGGEKSRLALALIIWQSPNLLLLDEPTNHLDLDMRHSLSLALQEYTGAMIIVSHDRFLLRSTVDQLLLIANATLTPFNGDLDDYETWLLQYRKQDNKKNSVSKPTSPPKGEPRPLQKTIKTLEEKMEKGKNKLAQIEIQLANPELYEENHYSTLQDLLAKQMELTKEIETIESAWLHAVEQLEIHDQKDIL